MLYKQITMTSTAKCILGSKKARLPITRSRIGKDYVVSLENLFVDYINSVKECSNSSEPISKYAYLNVATIEEMAGRIASVVQSLLRGQTLKGHKDFSQMMSEQRVHINGLSL